MVTLFLANVLGWVVIIIGLFLLLRHEHIKLIMEDVIAHPGLFFVFAFITLILGLLMVTSHNIWLMHWPVIVTLFGWLVLFSALIRLICPDTAMKLGKIFLSHPIRMQITGAVLLIIGVFLLFHVYYLHA